MREIPATLGRVALVDDADYERLSKYRWYAHNNGQKCKRPARRTSVAEGRKVLFLVHHIIPVQPGMCIDHINGDPWDNRRENLRVCTHAQNLKNQHRKMRGDLPKGVYKCSHRYQVYIRSDGQSYKLGLYATPEEAGRVYDSAALWLHRDFACLNYPDAGTVACDPRVIYANWKAKRLDRWGRPQIIRRLLAGEKARAVAKDCGCHVATVCKIAREAGITLARGRPRLSDERLAA